MNEHTISSVLTYMCIESSIRASVHNFDGIVEVDHKCVSR